MYHSELWAFAMLAMTGGGDYSGLFSRSGAEGGSDDSPHASLMARLASLTVEKDMLSAVINSLPYGIMLLDGAGKLLAANSKINDMLGVSLKGRLLEDMEHMPEDFPIKSFVGEMEEDGESTIGGKTYKIISIPIKDASAGELKEVRILRDITFEKSLEQKKADLVSMITHDIKSPMNAVLGMCQWLIDEEVGEGLGEDGKAAVEAISRASRRMLDLMENFVLLTSLEGMVQLNRRPVDLNLFLNKALLEFHMLAKKKNIRLAHGFASPSSALHVDEGQLMRAVSNIVNNALKYTPEGGVVSVTAENYGKYVTISVSDDGPGIKKEELPYIFDRYYRAANAEGIKGSGLGLAIAKAVVEAHGGSIEVVSEVGAGSTFIVRLPAHKPAENN